MRNMRSHIWLPVAVSVALGACGEAEDGDIGYGEDFEPPITEERAEQPAFADWDADGNQILGRDEFTAWWSAEGAYLTWDRDDVEGLNREEYAEGVFDAWDANDDGIVTQDEWDAVGPSFWGDDTYEDRWADFDRDGDSELDLNEVAEGFESEGLYDRVDLDRDGLIDDEELGDWFFDLIDTNDDHELDTTEWESTWLGIG